LQKIPFFPTFMLIETSFLLVHPDYIVGRSWN